FLTPRPPSSSVSSSNNPAPTQYYPLSLHDALPINGLGQLGPERALPMFADWTDRIAAGELPPTPPRPQGVERNVVITEWDWADPKAYLHDEDATDKRNPTPNPNALISAAADASA